MIRTPLRCESSLFVLALERLRPCFLSLAAGLASSPHQSTSREPRRLTIEQGRFDRSARRRGGRSQRRAVPGQVRRGPRNAGAVEWTNAPFPHQGRAWRSRDGGRFALRSAAGLHHVPRTIARSSATNQWVRKAAPFRLCSQAIEGSSVSEGLSIDCAKQHSSDVPAIAILRPCRKGMATAPGSRKNGNEKCCAVSGGGCCSWPCGPDRSGDRWRQENSGCDRP